MLQEITLCENYLKSLQEPLDADHVSINETET